MTISWRSQCLPSWREETRTATQVMHIYRIFALPVKSFTLLHALLVTYQRLQRDTIIAAMKTAPTIVIDLDFDNLMTDKVSICVCAWVFPFFLNQVVPDHRWFSWLQTLNLCCCCCCCWIFPKDLRKLSKQVLQLYGANTHAISPLHISLTGVVPNGKSFINLNRNSGYKQWLVSKWCCVGMEVWSSFAMETKTHNSFLGIGWK